MTTNKQVYEGITAKEKRKIEKWNYIFSDEKPNGQFVHCLIVVTHNEKNRHDSGYPYLRVFGIKRDNTLLDLGWHDHILTDEAINYDSLGKNINRIMPARARENGWQVSNSFRSCSSLMIRKGVLE